MAWDDIALLFMGGWTLFALVVAIYDYLARRSEKKAKEGEALK